MAEKRRGNGLSKWPRNDDLNGEVMGGIKGLETAG